MFLPAPPALAPGAIAQFDEPVHGQQVDERRQPLHRRVLAKGVLRRRLVVQLANRTRTVTPLAYEAGSAWL